MREYLAFAMLVVICCWSNFRGIQKWTKGERSIIWFFMGIFTLICIYYKLEEWL